ncbi:MAG: dipicolinate synthase subunit B [Clostridia bacterium]|nr:dipicolinate synthase subunit B [Clostridia bacterium]
MLFDGLRIGYAFCGSFCTIKKSMVKLKELRLLGCDLLPIMSETTYSTDTRFGKASDIISEIEYITGKKVLKNIVETEPIGPKKLVDILVIAPCTGNTLAKIKNAITDTSVTMAAKSHLRIARPLLLCISTNDGLGGSGANITSLINTKNIYFTPFMQDDHINKINSLSADFDLLIPSIESALEGRQLQPILKKAK